MLEAVGGEALEVVLEEENWRKVGLRRCTSMNQGSTMAKYSTMPGHHRLRRNSDHSRRRPAKMPMITSAMSGATGPLARVAAPTKK